MFDNLSFNYTRASLLAMVGAVIAVAVSFGLHLTQDNIHSILTFAGLILGVTAAAGGVKSAGLVRAGAESTGALHFTPAVVVSIIGAGITLAVTFGLHVTQENINSIMTLIGLIASGIIVGGGAKSNAMLRAGIHPALAKVKS